jgi:hypothetical protein
MIASCRPRWIIVVSRSEISIGSRVILTIAPLQEPLDELVGVALHLRLRTMIREEHQHPARDCVAWTTVNEAAFAS